jgi:hypothetical protein
MLTATSSLYSSGQVTVNCMIPVDDWDVSRLIRWKNPADCYPPDGLSQDPFVPA